jgi:hypothetical protein
MVSQDLLDELKSILESDYGLCLDPRSLSKIADYLVSYFGLLFKINNEFKLRANKNDKQRLIFKK